MGSSPQAPPEALQPETELRCCVEVRSRKLADWPIGRHSYIRYTVESRTADGGWTLLADSVAEGIRISVTTEDGVVSEHLQFYNSERGYGTNSKERDRVEGKGKVCGDVSFCIQLQSTLQKGAVYNANMTLYHPLTMNCHSMTFTMLSNLFPGNSTTVAGFKLGGLSYGWGNYVPGF